MRSSFALLLLSALLVPCAGSLAGGNDRPAQRYPVKPIRMIVPWVAGGSTDIVARFIAEKLSDKVGETVVVDNRPGANGIIGSELAAHALPDGYTIVLHAIGHVINPSTHRRLPYDTLHDFAGITKVGTQPLVLIVKASLPVASVAEFISSAKERPGTLSFGSWGEGSLPHLAGEMFKTASGVDILHVPYKGGPQAISDMLGGRLDSMFDSIPPALPLINTGKVRALAVPSAARATVLPDVPTLIECGYPDLIVEAWRAIYAPGDTPKAIIDQLNHAIVSIEEDRAAKERLLALGFQPVVSTPEELETFTRSELRKWAAVIKRAGMRVQ